MMNKKEVIEKIKNLNARETFMSEIIWVKRDDVLDIINQLEEPVKPPEPKPLKPEKPVIPQYVADYIASEQHSCSTLSEAIDNMDDEGQILNWFYINSETFAKAWIYGYEVEKEKLYIVELPNPNNERPIALRKDENGEVYIERFWCDGSEWITFYGTKLTENEIKKDFEWAWQFAEEVKK